MLYLLKFIYGVLLFPPGIFIIALLLAAWWGWRRSGRTAKAVLVITVVFYFCTTGLLAGAVLRSLEGSYAPPGEPRGDVIVMLGGGATLDTPDVGGPGHLSGYAANRLLTTVQLQRKLGVPIIVSGGRVFEDTGLEAEIASRILIGLGVPADKIITETASLNTTQNARYSAALLEQRGLKQPILVTSAFHMRRAVLQFEKAGVAVVPYPADYLVNRSGAFRFSDLWPSAGALQGLVLGLKEYLGLAVIHWY
ncbi:MAG: YdcF family protein [Negativicutes bacterium]|nr:YdcF family protein [Negativicutes bacterium]